MTPTWGRTVLRCLARNLSSRGVWRSYLSVFLCSASFNFCSNSSILSRLVVSPTFASLNCCFICSISLLGILLLCKSSICLFNSLIVASSTDVVFSGPRISSTDPKLLDDVGVIFEAMPLKLLLNAFVKT